MWTAFPSSDYYEDSAPAQGYRLTTSLPAPGPAGRKEGVLGTVPTFTADRSTDEAPSYSPAASPRVRRRLSSWPPRQPNQTGFGVARVFAIRACTATRPISARLEPVSDLRGFHHWFLHSYTFLSRLPDPGRLAVPTRPVVVRAAPARPFVSRGGLPSASAGRCDGPPVGFFHPTRSEQRLVAHD